MQPRLHSMLEAVANVAIGYSINFVANLVVLPLFGLAVSARDAAGIGLVFTGISLARSYVLRRTFNRLHGRRLLRECP
jgi:SNF family Na+-dependent transporter